MVQVLKVMAKAKAKKPRKIPGGVYPARIGYNTHAAEVERLDRQFDFTLTEAQKAQILEIDIIGKLVGRDEPYMSPCSLPAADSTPTLYIRCKASWQAGQHTPCWGCLLPHRLSAILHAFHVL